MADFEINRPMILQQVTKIEQIGNTIKNVVGMVANVNCNLEFIGIGHISSVLSAIEEDISKHVTRLNSLSYLLGKIVLTYELAEENIMGVDTISNEIIDVADFSAGAKSSDKEDLDLFKILKKVAAMMDDYYNPTCIITNDEIESILIDSGWDPDYVNEDMIEELAVVMDKYNITTREQICAFLAECMYESDYGRGLKEYGNEDYWDANGYGATYRGGGYIHVTWEYGYQAFATYLILQEVPELQDYATYLNPKNNDAESIAVQYNNLVVAAQDLGIDISNYTNIVDYGADYVAENYAWESAAYYWDANNINEVIDNGGNIDDVSSIINQWDTGTFDTREELYEATLDAYDDTIE